MTYPEILEQARKVLAPKCHVCPECNGLACRGMIPGPGGVGNGQSFTECRAFFKSIKLLMDAIHPDVEIDTSVELFGKTFSAPFFVAPIGGMSFNYTGHFTEAQFTEYIVQGALNCGTMAFTADGPDDTQFPSILPIIEKANGMAVSTVKPWEREKLMKRIRDLESVGAIGFASDIDSAALINLKLQGKPVSTKSVEEWKEITSSTHLPLVLKGVITPESALKCVEAGAYGIVVSTHGGRVMEDFPVPCSMLPEIRAAVGDRLKIFVDGGVRSGADVFKCLALGADAVLIGRPYVIAAHGGGTEGVELYTRRIMAELREAMMMTDCRTLSDITEKKIRMNASYT